MGQDVVGAISLGQEVSGAGLLIQVKSRLNLAGHVTKLRARK